MTDRKRGIRKTMTTNGQITAMPLCADIGILHTALLQEVAEMLREDVASEGGGSAVCCCMFVPVHGLCIRVGPPFSTVFL